MAESFVNSVKPSLTRRLLVDETLQGVIAATHQRTFSGSLYAVGVTDRRLLLQELDRKLQPKGEPVVIAPETLDSAKVDGAGEGYWSAPSAVLDATALAVTLRTTDGVKMKLLMMKGGGGLFGKLGGGQDQEDGITALGAWMRRWEEKKTA